MDLYSYLSLIFAKFLEFQILFFFSLTFSRNISFFSVPKYVHWAFIDIDSIENGIKNYNWAFKKWEFKIIYLLTYFPLYFWRRNILQFPNNKSKISK